MVILDTNAISELIAPKPDEGVVAWFEQQEANELFTSAITEAELRYGLIVMPKGKRRDDLGVRIERLIGVYFDQRILPFDSGATKFFGEIYATMKKRGGDPDLADAQIASIAKLHGFAVVTRNVKHFESCGVDLICPWTN